MTVLCGVQVDTRNDRDNIVTVWTEAPDFERLPAGTREQYEQRLERLPLHRIRTRIDFDAVRDNEDRFNTRFCAEHQLSENDLCALAPIVHGNC